MLSISDIILIGLVFMIIGILFFDTKNKINKKNEYSSMNTNGENSYQRDQLSLEENLVDEETIESYDSLESTDSDKSLDLNSSRGSSNHGSVSDQISVTHNIKRKPLNPNFLNLQFHNDYRDLMTSLHNIIPERRQRFNTANIPITYTEGDASEIEIKPMAQDLVHVINQNIKTQVPQERHKNSGWDEAMIDPLAESGWEKTQKSLGLPVSLYQQPAQNGLINLVAINNVQKYETEDEAKYTADIVIQKSGVEDQAIIKPSFVVDKRILRDENNFFINKKVDMRVFIEDITIIGYLSKGGPDSKLEFDMQDVKYYDYNTLEKNNMTDPKQVLDILMDKYDKRTKEMELRNAMLDDEGQAYHKSLPHMYQYDNIKGTRTIFDDMTKKKFFS